MNSVDFVYKNHFPNEEKIGEYNGDAIVKYPSKLSTYKDGEKEGEELSFDRIGHIVKISSYKKIDYMELKPFTNMRKMEMLRFFILNMKMEN